MNVQLISWIYMIQHSSPCKVFGIQNRALLIVHLNHGSKDSMMMTRVFRNMSL